MYSGEYDACDVTLREYPHRAGLKNMHGHGAWERLINVSEDIETEDIETDGGLHSKLQSAYC